MGTGTVHCEGWALCGWYHWHVWPLTIDCWFLEIWSEGLCVRRVAVWDR